MPDFLFWQISAEPDLRYTNIFKLIVLLIPHQGLGAAKRKSLIKRLILVLQLKAKIDFRLTNIFKLIAFFVPH